MHLHGLAFSPVSVSVVTAQSVYFVADDDALYTIVVNGLVASAELHQGDTASWVAGAAGTYQVTTRVHTQMRGTIAVR
jgi:plastocyanin